MHESPPRPLRVVLAGGSGLLGRLLAARLDEHGHTVTVLTRSPYTAPWTTVHWNARTAGPWVETLDFADACIDLTGAGAWRRLTAERRAEILEARLAVTELLGRTIAGLRYPPRVWMLGSSIDIYPHARDREMDESAAAAPSRRPSWRFAAELARENEAAFFSFAPAQTRQLALRTAPVCAPDPASLFGRLSRLVRMGLGGSLGGGRQFVSWIHALDYVRAVEFLIARPELAGVFNLTAPKPVRNRAFMEGLRWAWDVPNGLPAPWPAMELAALVAGPEVALLLKSRRIVPARLLGAGFRFAFPEWPEAAEELAERYRLRD